MAETPVVTVEDKAPLGGAAPVVGRIDWPMWWELIRVMLSHPWLLSITITPNVLVAALAPMQAWLAKHVLDTYTKGESVFLLNDLTPLLPVVLAVFFGLAALKMIEKIPNKMLDSRIYIDLQRIYFDRRPDEGSNGEHISRVANDCNDARKVLDLFQKELWLVAIGLPSVLIWQVSLASELLPALLIAALPPVLVSLLFGGLVQRYSHRTMRHTARVACAVDRHDGSNMRIEQESWYRARICYELSKYSAQTVADFAGWFGIALVIILGALGMGFIPQEVTAGEIAVFMINLRLIGKPLSQLVNVYIKARQSYPAVIRVLRPEREVHS